MEIRKITLDGWVKSGQGGTAVSYTGKEDRHIMLKVFASSVVGPQYVQSEFELSRKVASLGLRTPKALELVECNGCLSIVYECIAHKKSISRLCASNPEEIEHWAAVFARESCHLHSTVCEMGDFGSRKELMLDYVKGHRGYTEKTKKKIALLAQELSDAPPIVFMVICRWGI